MKKSKEVIVYFPNWNMDEKSAERGGEVSGIPWKSVTYINHAFFRVEVADGTKESTFEWRAAGKEPRTKFVISTKEPKADFEDEKRNHFSEYAKYSELHPEVHILISVGGWTDCGYFSEMAYTQEGRNSFVNSCMELMKEYSFIDGLDLDWEYPGASISGERPSPGPWDQGCPVWGTWQEDAVNFAQLCKDLRTAMDENFGKGTKLLTACCSGDTKKTLPRQDWHLAEPYLNYINIMTYDMAGVWDGITGYCTSLEAVKNAHMYLTERNIPVEKLNMGSILYASGFYIHGEIDLNHLVGVEIDPNQSLLNGSICQEQLKKFEKEAVSGYSIKHDAQGRVIKGEEFDRGGVGWHFYYDENAGASFMVNDDPQSEYYKWFFSYESALSLQAKIDYAYTSNMAGIIIWEVSQDTVGYPMIKQMRDGLRGESFA